jgi:hypothetical protein
MTDPYTVVYFGTRLAEFAAVDTVTQFLARPIVPGPAKRTRKQRRKGPWAQIFPPSGLMRVWEVAARELLQFRRVYSRDVRVRRMSTKSHTHMRYPLVVSPHAFPFVHGILGTNEKTLSLVLHEQWFGSELLNYIRMKPELCYIEQPV